jgi:hypothetical protein
MSEEYTTGTGIRLHIHDQAGCRGLFCVVHRPQPGPWRDWPTHWRDDVKMMERICPHGVGHPCAENYGRDHSARLVHGCDGCPCSPILEGQAWETPPALPTV